MSCFLKDRKGISIFQKILDESRCKPNKKGSILQKINEIIIAG